MPRSIHAHRGLAQLSRLVIADAIMQQPGLGLAQLADATGLHENTLRDHVRVLVDEGVLRAETEHRGTRGRPRMIYYSAVDAGIDNDAAQRRIDEAKRRGDLLRRVMAIDTDGQDPDAVHQIDALYEHLEDFDFAPEVDDADLRVDLKPCPFHDLVDAQPVAVCRVHEQLIREVLERAGGPIEVDRLLPLVTEHRCSLQLRMGTS